MDVLIDAELGNVADLRILAVPLQKASGVTMPYQKRTAVARTSHQWMFRRATVRTRVIRYALTALRLIAVPHMDATVTIITSVLRRTISVRQDGTIHAINRRIP